MPSYSGASKSSIYAKQATLRKAAKANGNTMTSYFQSRTEDPIAKYNAMRAAEEGHHGHAPVSVVPEAQGHLPPPTALAVTPQAEPTTEPACDEQVQDSTLINHTRDAAPPPGIYDMSHFLDMTADKDTPQAPLGEVVKQLNDEANKHKSFTALFKLQAVKAYLELHERYRLIPKVTNPATRASLVVAKSVGKGPYFARRVRKLVTYIKQFQCLPPTGSGKHHAHPSLLNNERVHGAVRRFLTVQEPGEITPLSLQRHVNNTIIPKLGLDLGQSKISVECARRWLKKLGYELVEAKKALYLDGHKRPDVVKYRYDDVTLESIDPILGPGEKLHILVDHDESVIRPNELRRRVYIKGGKNGKMPLRKKGLRKAIHVSGWIVEETGTLSLSDEQRDADLKLPPEERLPTHNAHEIIYPGKNADGWWNCECLIKQVKRTIPVFERLYPNAIAEFIFDQSSAHGAHAPDALNVKEMNVGPGGVKRRMHTTTIPLDNPNPTLRGICQEMIFSSDLPPNHPHYKHRGKQKGMRIILEERGLLAYAQTQNGGMPIIGDCHNCKLSQKARDQLARNAAASELFTPDSEDEDTPASHTVCQLSTSSWCCMQKILSLQQDFLDEKPLLQIIIEGAGHKCYFLPKFHCKLNPIEIQFYMGDLIFGMSGMRNLADGTFPTAKRLVPELLDACPSWRYMDAYSKGLDARQAEFAVKKYRSHRRIGPQVMMSLGIFDNPE
ncbi:hypothetical protein BJV78DRAFT_1277581 [Lactifluus subvellereus]|nr:hypothetical protein BJV78DRAFT_1277581 [Lactifluus subvellereus]